MICSEKFANEYCLPLIRLIEGTGGGGSIKSLEDSGYSYVPFNPGWDIVVNNLSKIPVISIAMGPVAGLGAARLVSSHYSIMIKEQSQIFVAGPPLVKRIGENISKEDLGGSEIHGKNGVVDDVANSEKEAIDMAKLFLSYLPSSINEIPTKKDNKDSIKRKDNILNTIIPKNKRESYDIMPIIKTICDKDSFFEIGRKYGLSVISGFARLDGYPIVVLANNDSNMKNTW